MFLFRALFVIIKVTYFCSGEVFNITLIEFCQQNDKIKQSGAQNG
jgi:hypothetical protein